MMYSRIRLKSSAPIADPEISSPTGTTVDATSATGTVKIDHVGSAITEVGTLYYYASQNASESLATILASGSTQAVTEKGGLQSVTFTGLTGSTTYYAHYVFLNDQDEYSNRVVSASFTTDAAASGGFPVLAGRGGLAGEGGLAGRHGGLAG